MLLRIPQRVAPVAKNTDIVKSGMTRSEVTKLTQRKIPRYVVAIIMDITDMTVVITKNGGVNVSVKDAIKRAVKGCFFDNFKTRIIVLIVLCILNRPFGFVLLLVLSILSSVFSLRLNVASIYRNTK